MKIRERLLECKVKAKISSDYKLAEVLGTRRQVISELMNGKRKPDAYIAVRIGEILKIHPMMLWAEFEAESAKTVERKTFWENFGQRIKTGAVAMGVLIFTAFWSPESGANDLVLNTHNVYYVKLHNNVLLLIIQSVVDLILLTCQLKSRAKAIRKPLVFDGHPG